MLRDFREGERLLRSPVFQYLFSSFQREERLTRSSVSAYVC